MDFLGGVNVLQGHVTGDRAVFRDLVVPWAGQGGGPARAYVRGHDLLLHGGSSEALRGFPLGDGTIAVTVERIRRVGVAARVHVASEHHGELTAELPHRELAALGIEQGAKLFAHVRSARVFLRQERRQEAA